MWNRKRDERRRKIRMALALFGAMWIGFFAGWNLQVPADEGLMMSDCKIFEAPPAKEKEVYANNS